MAIGAARSPAIIGGEDITGILTGALLSAVPHFQHEVTVSKLFAPQREQLTRLVRCAISLTRLFLSVPYPGL